jgi:hypothetical protein
MYVVPKGNALTNVAGSAKPQRESAAKVASAQIVAMESVERQRRATMMAVVKDRAWASAPRRKFVKTVDA